MSLKPSKERVDRLRAERGIGLFEAAKIAGHELFLERLAGIEKRVLHERIDARDGLLELIELIRDAS